MESLKDWPPRLVYCVGIGLVLLVHFFYEPSIGSEFTIVLTGFDRQELTSKSRIVHSMCVFKPTRCRLGGLAIWAISQGLFSVLLVMLDLQMDDHSFSTTLLGGWA